MEEKVDFEQWRARRKRERWPRSQLAPFLDELIDKRTHQNASYQELAGWLSYKHGVNVHRTTIERFIKRWGKKHEEHHQKIVSIR